MKITPSLLAASLLALGLSTAPAHALNTRSFISANGLDTNACTRPAPCRTLQKAHDSTNAGGEINMLDPAGYGPVTITKAISIVNDGVGSAGILVPSAQIGITINAGVNDAVNLRGLIIEGAGVGNHGIKFNTGKSLNIENRMVRNIVFEGVSFAPNASSTLAVSDTVVAVAAHGFFVVPSGSGTVKASFNRVEAYSTSIAIRLTGSTSTGSVNATVVDSVTANGSIGFHVDTTSAATVLNVIRSVSANNATRGLNADGAGAKIRIGQSAVTDNATNGFRIVNSAIIESFQDNYIAGNGSNVGSLTGISRQ